MFDPSPSLWEQVKNAVLQIWSWLPKAGFFGVGFFVGSVFFKPIFDLLAAIESRRKASIELQRTKSDSHDHLKTIEALEAELSQARAEISIGESRLKEASLRRYILGTSCGLILGGAAAGVFYFRVPVPIAPVPTATYAVGYDEGYRDGLRGRRRSKKVQTPPPETSVQPTLEHND